MRPLHTHWGSHNQNQMLTSGVEDVGKLDLSYVAGKNVKWGSHFGKQSKSALEANHELTICFSNSTFRNIPREIKTCFHTKSHIQMFISVLFIIAKSGKHPSVHQQMNG